MKDWQALQRRSSRVCPCERLRPLQRVVTLSRDEECSLLRTALAQAPETVGT